MKQVFRFRMHTSQPRGSVGLALHQEPSTTSMGGSSACNPLAMTDLPVPRRPMMATPPSWLSTCTAGESDRLARQALWKSVGNCVGTVVSAAAADNRNARAPAHTQCQRRVRHVATASGGFWLPLTLHEKDVAL